MKFSSSNKVKSHIQPIRSSVLPSPSFYFSLVFFFDIILMHSLSVYMYVYTPLLLYLFFYKNRYSLSFSVCAFFSRTMYITGWVQYQWLWGMANQFKMHFFSFAPPPLSLSLSCSHTTYIPSLVFSSPNKWKLMISRLCLFLACCCELPPYYMLRSFFVNTATNISCTPICTHTHAQTQKHTSTHIKAHK